MNMENTKQNCWRISLSRTQKKKTQKEKSNTCFHQLVFACFLHFLSFSFLVILVQPLHHPTIHHEDRQQTRPKTKKITAKIDNFGQICYRPKKGNIWTFLEIPHFRLKHSAKSPMPNQKNRGPQKNCKNLVVRTATTPQRNPEHSQQHNQTTLFCSDFRCQRGLRHPNPQKIDTPRF